jgi:transcriptional regulator with XRE-family HTH domain
MKTEREAVGRRIREVRLRLKMTQKQLGQHLGVVPSAVSAYESGCKFPPPDTLAKIVKIGGISYDWLFLGGPVLVHPADTPLERLAAKVVEYVEATGGERLLAEIMTEYQDCRELWSLTEDECRMLEKFRGLTVEQRRTMLEEIGEKGGETAGEGSE